MVRNFVTSNNLKKFIAFTKFFGNKKSSSSQRQIPIVFDDPTVTVSYLNNSLGIVTACVSINSLLVYGILHNFKKDIEISQKEFETKIQVSLRSIDEDIRSLKARRWF